MELLSLTIDTILLIIGIIMTYYTYQLGGKIGHNSLNYMIIGFFILGIAHITETLLFWLIPTLSIEIQELTHRLLVLIGFIFIVIGYSKLLKFVKS